MGGGCANTLYRHPLLWRVEGKIIVSHPYAPMWPPQLPILTRTPSLRHFLLAESLHKSIENPYSVILVGWVGHQASHVVVRTIGTILLQHGNTEHRMYDRQTGWMCKLESYLVDLSEYFKRANIPRTQLASPPKACAPALVKETFRKTRTWWVKLMSLHCWST